MRFWTMLAAHCLWIAAAVRALLCPAASPLGLRGGLLLLSLAALGLWLGLLWAAHSYLALANRTSVEMMQDWGAETPKAYTLRYVAPLRVPFVGRYLHHLRLFCCFQDDCVLAAAGWLSGRSAQAPPRNNVWEVEAPQPASRHGSRRRGSRSDWGRQRHWPQWLWRMMAGAGLKGKQLQGEGREVLGDQEEDDDGGEDEEDEEEADWGRRGVRHASVWEDICDNEYYTCC